MPLYENVFIARQDMSPAQVESLADEYESVLAEHGGAVRKREHWGLKTLAYRIRKNRKGHYVLFNFDGPSGAIQEIERRMRLSEDVLRYLTLRIEEVDERPSVMLQARPRDDRGRREVRPRPDRDAAGASDAKETAETGEASPEQATAEETTA